jgi:hypothetical protein
MRKPTLSTREPTQLNEKEENRRSTVPALSPGNFPTALQDIKKSRKKLKTLPFSTTQKKIETNKKKHPRNK